MPLAEDRAAATEDVDEGFAVDDISTGLHASGFGQVGDGRSFSFHVERQTLFVEVYRPRLTGPMPHADDVVATSSRGVAHIDIADERSLIAVVRDAVADVRPVPRSAP